jgi:C-terminal processing protease CtpA/Prc
MGRGWGSLYFLNDSNGRDYARTLRTLLKDLDAKQPLGWVVDLRANVGGDMWPMLDGLGPLLGEGRISAILMPQWGRRVDTWLVAGQASSGPPWFGALGLRGPEKLLLRTASAPVAVLVGPRTASSGEAVAVAFRGRPNTYFVGAPTAGLATSTMRISLPDGAELLLAAGYLADRMGRRYEGPIAPDAHVPTTRGRDETYLVASRWILSRPR